MKLVLQSQNQLVPGNKFTIKRSRDLSIKRNRMYVCREST
jgi:hypothetical protein